MKTSGAQTKTAAMLTMAATPAPTRAHTIAPIAICFATTTDLWGHLPEQQGQCRFANRCRWDGWRTGRDGAAGGGSFLAWLESGQARQPGVRTTKGPPVGGP